MTTKSMNVKASEVIDNKLESLKNKLIEEENKNAEPLPVEAQQQSESEVQQLTEIQTTTKEMTIGDKLKVISGLSKSNGELLNKAKEKIARIKKDKLAIDKIVKMSETISDEEAKKKILKLSEIQVTLDKVIETEKINIDTIVKNAGSLKKAEKDLLKLKEQFDKVNPV